MPYAQIAIGLIIVGEFITIVVLSRKLGKSNERTGILERGLHEAKIQLAKANLAPVIDSDEQSDKL